ncbi:hypothetical protein [Pelagibacterium xiamenense]|uniref:hypothetical protein n=1 Tax=Pelagibacterium xiamenense TaxID=2901140 RepID=UPI001E3C3D58|nr:hypothetical protein [Pelagibacterium xiamenense]
MNGLIRHLHMQRILVGIGINRHRLNTHPPRGLDNPAGNFTAIGYEDLGEHLVATKYLWKAGSSHVNIDNHPRPYIPWVKALRDRFDFSAKHSVQSPSIQVSSLKFCSTIQSI